MKTIQIQKLSREAFAKYGEYLDLLNDAELKEKSFFPGGFFNDVMKLNFGYKAVPTISVCQVFKKDEMAVRMLETHDLTSEVLIPLDDDVVIFAGVAMPGRPLSTDNLEAFLIPKGTAVQLNPLVVHGTQFPVNAEEAHVICMLPNRTAYHDMNAVHLSEEDKALLVFA